MCLQCQACHLIYHLIPININMHGSRRKESVLLFYLLDKVQTHAVEHCHRKEISSIMAVNSAIFPKIYANAISRHEQKKQYCPMQHLFVINKSKHKTEKLLSHPILCPLCYLYQRKHIKTKFTQLRIYFNVACQVHIVGKRLLKNLNILLLKSTIQR